MSKRDSHSDRRGFVYAPTQKMQWLVGLTPSIEHSLATPRGSTVAEPWCKYALLDVASQFFCARMVGDKPRSVTRVSTREQLRMTFAEAHCMRKAVTITSQCAAG
jgi:hypothetical protein